MPEPVVVMPSSPIQSAVTVPELKLSVIPPVVVDPGVSRIGLEAVPVPSEPALEIVVVPAGNDVAVPPASVSAENVLLLKNRRPPPDVLAATVREPKVCPPPLNCLSLLVVALSTIGAVKVDVPSSPVTVPMSKTTPDVIVIVKVPEPNAYLRVPVPVKSIPLLPMVILGLPEAKFRKQPVVAPVQAPAVSP